MVFSLCVKQGLKFYRAQFSLPDAVFCRREEINFVTRPSIGCHSKYFIFNIFASNSALKNLVGKAHKSSSVIYTWDFIECNLDVDPSGRMLPCPSYPEEIWKNWNPFNDSKSAGRKSLFLTVDQSLILFFIIHIYILILKNVSTLL